MDDGENDIKLQFCCKCEFPLLPVDKVELKYMLCDYCRCGYCNEKATVSPYMTHCSRLCLIMDRYKEMKRTRSLAVAA